MKLAALSVDLDEIPCYHAIHGLAAPDDSTAHAVYRRAVPRYRELFRELEVPCTFFVIGRDAGDETAAAALRGLAHDGHELANHTMNHRYDLVRLGANAMRREVQDGIDAITRATGVRPSGFRAPGYTITDELFDVLSECDVRYDSSVFPCPAYWSAKATVIAWIRMRGRRSASIVDTPGVLTAPADPYTPGRPYWRRGTDGPFELPIAVTRGARLPFIGTYVMLGGPMGARCLARMMLGRELVNLELHGIDVLSAEGDGLAALGTHQRDLSIPVERKIATLRATVDLLRSRGYRFVTLREAADEFETAQKLRR